jgi:hypothetical protein
MSNHAGSVSSDEQHVLVGASDTADHTGNVGNDRDLTADERDLIASERERLADEREALADRREQLADARERGLDELEQRLALRGSGVEQWHQTLRQTSRAGSAT